MTPGEHARVRIDLGPLSINYPDYVAIRLNEHVVHTWDIEVALRPDATLSPDVVAVVIDNLGLVTRYTARPTGGAETITVRTSEPVRTFTIVVAPDAVTCGEGDDSENADLELPAEAFVRLVYGRLDREHTPPGVTGGHHLDHLREVFPGP